MKKKYRIKVTEMHTDYVWIEADSEKEALEKAHAESECEFDSLHNTEIVKTSELD